MKKLRKAILIAISLVIMITVIYSLSKLFAKNPTLIGNSIDNKIPFVPQFVFFYCTWFALIFLIPIILYMKNSQYFKRYIRLAIIGNLMISMVFIIYPTTMIRADFEVTGFTTWLINFIYKVDSPVINCFPSGHCYYALLFILCTSKVKEIKPKYRILIAILSVLIMISTVLIKQHVLMDVIGAVALAIIVMIISYFIERSWIKIDKKKRK